MGAAHWPTNRAECFLPKHLSVAEAAMAVSPAAR